MPQTTVRRSPNRPDFVVDTRGCAFGPGRKNKVRLKVAAVCGAVAVALASPASNVGGSFLSVSRAAVDGVSAMAEAIRKRSPGLRTRADIGKGKFRARPVARAKPRIRQPVRQIAAPARPILPLSPPPLANPLAFLDRELVPTGPVQVASLPGHDLAVPCDCVFAFLPPGQGLGIILPPGGGGGVILPPPPPPPGGIVPNPPAIPEASTWAMMIFGFGVIGTLWRRRRQIIRAIATNLLPRLGYVPVRLLPARHF